jgi:hypothetical protein
MPKSEDLDQGIDLVFLAHGADLEKGETCMHGQHHDGAEQNEQHVAAGLIRFHETPTLKMGASKQAPFQCIKNVTNQCIANCTTSLAQYGAKPT